MNKKILIAGNFGFYNTGDEAILAAMIDSLLNEHKNLDFCVVSGSPEYTKSLFNVDSIFWQDIPSIIRYAENCDLILLGGGGIFNDYWGVQPEKILTKDHAGISYYCEFAMLANLLNKPLMIFAAGVGPLLSKEGRELVRLSFNQAQAATVRDNESLKVLEEIGCDLKNVSVTADPGFILTGDSETARKILSDLIPDRGIPTIAVCLRNWDVGCDQDSWQQKTAEAFDSIIETHPYNLLFLPFHNLKEYPLTNDISAAEKVTSLMKNKNHVLILRELYSPEVIEGFIENCSLVIGMRYHSIIFAANAAIPMVGLMYDQKVKQLLNQLGLGGFSVDLVDITADLLASKINEVRTNYDQIHQLLLKKKKYIQRIAGKNSRIASGLIGIKKSVFDKNDQMDTYIKWVVLNQSRILFEKEGLVSSNITKIDQQSHSIEQLNSEAMALQNKIQEKTNQLEELNNKNLHEVTLLKKQIQNNKLQIRKIKTANQKDSIEFNNQLDKKQLKIDELETIHYLEEKKFQEMNDHLDGISRSRGWKFLQFLWKIRILLVPHNSKREKIIKQFFRVFGKKRMPSGIKVPRIFRDGYIDQDNSTVTLYTDNDELFPNYSSRCSLMHSKPDNLQISLIATIKDDKNNIENWLKDVQNQIRKPDEIVVVDGGSTDGSFDILNKLTTVFPIPLRIIKADGANRAEGRNVAISHANYPLIAVTDFGCHIDPLWLQKLVQPFIICNETQVSSGFYHCLDSKKGLTDQNSLWANMQNIHPQHFLPSSRSIAFLKSAVNAIGGYPEWLISTGEDTYLDLELKRLGGKWAFVPEALVYWHAPTSIISFLKKNYLWAIGDGESGVHARYYWRYVIQLLKWALVFLFSFAVILFIVLIPVKFAALWCGLICLAFLFGMLSTAHKNKLNLIELTQRMFSEIAQVLGFIKGLPHENWWNGENILE